MTGSDASRPTRPVILVVDDDAGLRESFRLILDDEYEVIEAPDGPTALGTLRSAQVDLVLLDIRLPHMDGIQVLERIKGIDDSVQVILVTAVKTVRTAVAAMKLGAFDYLTKPFDEEELFAVIRRALERRSLEREVQYLRSELDQRDGAAQHIIGEHAEMQKLAKVIAQTARTTTTVLITGESGTGKELVARAIHRQGPRRDKPFVAVNPAAISESLMESELFGHEKGAFTGARQRKIGRFEMAHGGTLFLDEIGTLKHELQAKLLRVIQEREIERVGSMHTIKLDVRFIAATNVDLKQAVAQGTFREDLYYRLNVVPIHVPPLRERREDIPVLVDHFVDRYSRRFGRPVTGVSPEALGVMRDYPWPGNVRELQNVIERLVGLADGPVIGVDDLPFDLMFPDCRAKLKDVENLPLKEATEEFERQIILRVLERVGWNQSEASRILGVHRNSLKVKLERWGIRSLRDD
ncbi:MAG: sigma-54-dependent Fis family transcriptional regulator [Candidatus Rokubacteria bacterium]|nr:sigma-54-dependent Fis family transcriptional regulator [Candidatus Rokubacteria bacterium]